LKAHEGNLYCRRHYQPIAQKLEEERRHEEMRKKRPRQLLVARYMDGRCKYGVSFALNIREAGFHLDVTDISGVPLGKTEDIRFQDLKAVFLVKSFDGRFDKDVQYKEWVPEGSELMVEFKDGEVVRGLSLRRYEPNDPRFHLIPNDPKTNNISIVVEASAVKSVSTPEEYIARRTREREEAREQGDATLSQEESTGDFYFETRNYPSALEQYRLAAAKFPQSSRLRKKIILAQYNVAMHHIKRHEYKLALLNLESVLKADPRNERVAKKTAQLRHIIEKEGSGRTQEKIPLE
jgi:tetratricopeptide (TPR) repeat protein